MLLVLDRSEPLDGRRRALLDETATANRIVVSNKSDLPTASVRHRPAKSARPSVPVSALTGDGFDELRQTIAGALVGEERLRDARADFQHAAHHAARAVPRFPRGSA